MFGTKEKEKELKLKRFIVMRKYNNSDVFFSEQGFTDKNYADEYAELMRKQDPNYNYYLFEQSKHYGNGEDKDA